MKSDETDVKGNVSKEVLADVDDSAINESKKKNEGKRKAHKKASFSEIVSFSRLTLIGTCLFVLAIIATMLFGLASQELAGGRYAIALFGITGLILFFGIVLDVLRWRDYSEWGALGAIIAYIGVFIMFLPLLLLPFIDLPFEGLLIIELIGGIITIIGFTSHRTDLDDKVVDLLTILWYRLRTFDFRAFFSTLWQLVRTTVGGFIRYIIQGLKNLPNRIRTFFSKTFHTLGNILKTSLNVIGQTLKRSLIGLWNNLHWIGLITVIIYFILVDLPIPNADPILIKVELIIIIGFFFCLGVLYPQRDRFVLIAKSMRNSVLSGVISTYSMLSGTKIKADQSVFCSRCLRGVDIREFESLMEIKGMVNPSCPFCGFNNWVGFEYTSTSIDKLRREEKLEVQTTQKPVVKDIPPSEISVPIVDEKAIKKGKFPDYQSYKRAQDLGVQNYSELEYIDRLGAPDLETAVKIRKGGFAHYKTFQDALRVGASNVSELRLIKDLNTPDLETAIEVQKSSFPDYPSYQRAHDLGASNYSELKFIDHLQAPNYETAIKMKRGKFPNYSSYKRAQDLGASNYSELEEIDHYQAPDFETVKKIRKGRFPNFQTYQKAQKVGVSSIYEYQSIEFPEFVESKTVNGVPPPQESVVIGKETSKLLEKLLKVSQKLADSNKQMREWYRSLLRNVTQYQIAKIELGPFERMLRHSGELLLKINIEEMQPDEVWDYEEIHTLLHALLRTFHPQRDKPLPEKERRRTPRRVPKMTKHPSWDTTFEETILEIDTLITCHSCGEKQDQMSVYCASCGIELLSTLPQRSTEDSIQQELEIITELINLQSSSLVGRISHLLQQLEKRQRLSPKAIIVVKDFRNHQDDVIRQIAKRIMQDLGARDYSDLEYIDRLNTPDFETRKTPRSSLKDNLYIIYFILLIISIIWIITTVFF